jgi:hypothetical protein
LFKVGYGEFKKTTEINLIEYYTEDWLINDLKNKLGILTIDDIRVTYDNDMYFLLSGSIILVIGFVPNTYSEISDQIFWTIDDLDGSNKQEAEDLRELRKVEPEF